MSVANVTLTLKTPYLPYLPSGNTAGNKKTIYGCGYLAETRNKNVSAAAKNILLVQRLVLYILGRYHIYIMLHTGVE